MNQAPPKPIEVYSDDLVCPIMSLVRGMEVNCLGFRCAFMTWWLDRPEVEGRTRVRKNGYCKIMDLGVQN